MDYSLALAKLEFCTVSLFVSLVPRKSCELFVDLSHPCSFAMEVGVEVEGGSKGTGNVKDDSSRR